MAEMIDRGWEVGKLGRYKERKIASPIPLIKHSLRCWVTNCKWNDKNQYTFGVCKLRVIFIQADGSCQSKEQVSDAKNES